VAVLDIRMPRISGLEVLRSVRDVSPSTRVIMMTGYAAVDGAVEAIKLGALDYLQKPLDTNRLRTLLSAIHSEDKHPRQVLTRASEFELSGTIGRSATLRSVFELVRRVAPSARVVLVTGETGTGKARRMS
jgi:DNA-binding NtrC family response regulator